MKLLPDKTKPVSVLKPKIREFLIKLRHKTRRSETVAVSCPVCQHIKATRLRYPPFEAPNIIIPAHDKYECESCGHIFTRWLPDDISDLGDLYSMAYDTNGTSGPNPRKSAECKLLDRVIAAQGVDGNYLDFSCGNNYSAVTDARSAGKQVYGCDIRDSFPIQQDGLFQYHPDMNLSQKFDGIVSVDALEHVQNIKATWKFLNRALVDGGIMFHSFPTAFRFQRSHHFLQIPFHSSLFSRESLSKWSERMGFDYRGERELSGSDVGYYYAFEKIKSL